MLYILFSKIKKPQLTCLHTFLNSLRISSLVIACMSKRQRILHPGTSTGFAMKSDDESSMYRKRTRARAEDANECWWTAMTEKGGRTKGGTAQWNEDFHLATERR